MYFFAYERKYDFGIVLSHHWTSGPLWQDQLRPVAVNNISTT